MGSLESQAVETETQFRAFYEAEVARQVRSATLVLGSRAAAQDAVHDAFVSVWQRWGSVTDPGPYLQRAVLNRCRDLRRRSQVADRHMLRLVAAPSTAAAEPDVELFNALSRLPFNHRAAVVLRYYLGLSETEIAERLGCRQGSVGPWIRRGLDRLATHLSSPQGH